MPSRIYDTSALVRVSNKEKGFENVAALLHAGAANAAREKASALSAFEFLFSIGKRGGEPAVKSLIYFQKILDFLPTDFETAQRAAFLKLKYPQLNLSMADAIILQTGIDNDFEIVTCDKVWAQVKEAKVTVV